MQDVDRTEQHLDRPIETESEFEAWLGEYSTFAQSVARAETGTENVLNLVSREVEAASVEKKSAP